MPQRPTLVTVGIFVFVLIAAVAVASVVRGRWVAGDDTLGSDTVPTSAPAFAPSAAQPSPIASPAPSSARTPTVTLTPVGSLNPGADGFHADVAVHNGFAYLGTWGSGNACPATGVKVVDVGDPAAPRSVATVAAIRGTSQEDIVVRGVTTPSFRGDLLAVGIQSCGGGALGGLALYDVSDPRRPVELSFLPTGGRGVHELDLTQQGSRVLALLAVPDSEVGAARTGDFRIVDVTNPRSPVQLSQWGAGARLGLDLGGGIGCVHRIYDHSARASADGRRAYLSYWDAGVIVLDISDPSEPRFLGRAAYPESEAGTTHSVAEAAGGRLLLTADEETVFDVPPGLWLDVQSASGVVSVHGCLARFSPSLDETGQITSQLVDAGSGCTAPAASVRDKVALVDEEGGCTLSDKVSRLAGLGADAVLIAVRGQPTSGSGGARARIPSVFIAAEDAAKLRNAATAGTLPITLPSRRPWGGLRLWDISDASRPVQVGIFQTENSERFPTPDDGYYTIHNPEVIGNLAVLSWWSDGVRVVDISDPVKPREVAAYVPPAAPNPQRAVFPFALMVWGVAVDGDLVFVSDVNSGLHILRLTTTP